MLTNAYADRGRPTLKELVGPRSQRETETKLEYKFGNNCLKKTLLKCVIKSCCKMLPKTCKPATYRKFNPR